MNLSYVVVFPVRGIKFVTAHDHLTLAPFSGMDNK